MQLKKVLIICGTFPPQSDVGGLRPAMFAKYLPEYGWEPWILTRDYDKNDPRFDIKMVVDLKIDKAQIIRVPYSIEEEKKYIKSRNFLNASRDFFFPEYSSPPGLYFKMKTKALKLLNEQQFDLIFSSSPDQWELTLGAYLSKLFKVPLVSDFRDIKEQEEGKPNNYRVKLQIKRFLTRRYITTRNVKLITTVSNYHKTVLSKHLKRRTEIVYNGFDDDLFKPTQPTINTKNPFRIVYMGRIIDLWYQNPQLLLTSIDELISEKKISSNDIIIDFYGTNELFLKSILSELNNTDFISFKQRIEYSEVPGVLNSAQVLLLLTNNGRKGILTTKFFEYAGVKKTILCIPRDGGELDELIEKYNLGISIDSIEKLKSIILEYVEKWKSGTFNNYIESNIEFFTRRNQTKFLAQLFNKATE